MVHSRVPTLSCWGRDQAANDISRLMCEQDLKGLGNIIQHAVRKEEVWMQGPCWKGVF